MRTLLKNGNVFDGLGSLPEVLDVLIDGESIGLVGRDLVCESDEVIDISGFALTPGFIDMHRHCDLAALYDPLFGEIEASQGVTCAFMGNCGIAPVPRPVDWHMRSYVEPVIGKVPPEFGLDSYGSYAGALKNAKLPISLGFFAGTGAILASVKGFSKEPLTDSQLDRAVGLAREAMEAGAAGVSMGLMYQPECWASEKELSAIAREASRFGKLLVMHIRNEGGELSRSVTEAIRIAQISEVRLNISHFKVTGKKNWGSGIQEAIELVESARASGADVTVDFYPYDAGATTLLSVLPPTVPANSESDLAELATDSGKRFLAQEMEKSHEGWENMAKEIGWDAIVISSVSRPDNQWMLGKSVAGIAGRLGVKDPVQLVAELLASENGTVGIILHSMSFEDVKAISKLDYAALISDSLYGGGSRPHPRLYGSFPKFLQQFCLESKLMPPEIAIKKMTSMPAKRVGLLNQGCILPGYRADLLVFKLPDFISRADWNDPCQLASGLKWGFIGGKLAVDSGRLTGARNGIVV
ncbi:MAG: amidohydrolase family protein [Clostridiales bacterium]|jgi:N-acyl-D-amino-acid deacylase|nr:amidohydrolase family protein [Clostridiales bacterium]